MLVIIPRDRAGEYGRVAKEFDGIPGCRVILDRRVAERRRAQNTPDLGDRRRGERRSGDLDDSRGPVVLLR